MKTSAIDDGGYSNGTAFGAATRETGSELLRAPRTSPRSMGQDVRSHPGSCHHSGPAAHLFRSDISR